MNRESISCLILFCALAAVAPAHVAAQAVAQPAPKPAARQAEPVGRLFFTPAQRASLDAARTQKARNALSSDKAEDAAPAAQTLTYGGMIRRSDGKSTIWINNRAAHDNEPGTGAIVGRVRPDGGVSLQVPQTGRIIDLKPGQSVELLSGTIEEAFSRRLVQPESKPAGKPAADGKSAKPEAPGMAKTERDREDRDQQQLQDAIRATQDAAGAKPGTAPPVDSPR